MFIVLVALFHAMLAWNVLIIIEIDKYCEGFKTLVEFDNDSGFQICTSHMPDWAYNIYHESDIYIIVLKRLFGVPTSLRAKLTEQVVGVTIISLNGVRKVLGSNLHQVVCFLRLFESFHSSPVASSGIVPPQPLFKFMSLTNRSNLPVTFNAV
jgi:hypothetical protein